MRSAKYNISYPKYATSFHYTERNLKTYLQQLSDKEMELLQAHTGADLWEHGWAIYLCHLDSCTESLPPINLNADQIYELQKAEFVIDSSAVYNGGTWGSCS